MKKSMKALFFDPQIADYTTARRNQILATIIMVTLAAALFTLHVYGNGG